MQANPIPSLCQERNEYYETKEISHISEACATQDSRELRESSSEKTTFSPILEFEEPILDVTEIIEEECKEITIDGFSVLTEKQEDEETGPNNDKHCVDIDSTEESLNIIKDTFISHDIGALRKAESEDMDSQKKGPPSAPAEIIITNHLKSQMYTIQ